jgi:MOSC domain-containing protein YiiM
MLDQTEGKLLAIAVKSRDDGSMHLLDKANITKSFGVENDPRGKRPSRQVTVVSSESWAAVCADLGKEIPWTLRRANLLLDGISLPNSKGKKLIVGNVEMEVTFETTPCHVMDEAENGLKDALVADWRGGVLCRVLKEGNIKCGDTVKLV